MTQSDFFCYIASWARNTDKSCGPCGIRGTLNSQSEEQKPFWTVKLLLKWDKI